MEIPEREFWRKGIHFSGIFLIPLLFWHRWLFALLIGLCLTAYLFVETQIRRERNVPVLGPLTKRSKRESEEGKISKGAVLLFVSGLVLPYLMGQWPAAVGLTQVFAADATATLAGMKWGEKKLPYAAHKTWVGSAVYLATAFVVALPFVSVWQAVILALAGALIESIPWPEIDNFTIPFSISLLSIGLGFVRFV